MRHIDSPCPGTDANGLHSPQCLYCRKLTLLGVTKHRLEVLRLIAKGYTNFEIGLALDISENTVKRHITKLMASAKSTNRVMLVGWAHDNQLLKQWRNT